MNKTNIIKKIEENYNDFKKAMEFANYVMSGFADSAQLDALNATLLSLVRDYTDEIINIINEEKCICEEQAKVKNEKTVYKPSDDDFEAVLKAFLKKTGA